ncbi:MAG: hypothetical protein V7K90_12990 [Nostoc sp.]
MMHVKSNNFQQAGDRFGIEEEFRSQNQDAHGLAISGGCLEDV